MLNFSNLDQPACDGGSRTSRSGSRARAAGSGVLVRRRSSWSGFCFGPWSGCDGVHPRGRVGGRPAPLQCGVLRSGSTPHLSSMRQESRSSYALPCAMAITCNHMWRCLGFGYLTTQLARDFLNFFTTASTCDENITRQVSSISDFVWILYNFKTLFAHVSRQVTTPTWSSFHARSQIGPQHTLNIINTIFWTKKFHYFMYLQFKFGVTEKIQRNRNN
jgi:hypothetical protein